MDESHWGKKRRVALFVESHEGYGHFNIVAQLAKKLQDEGAEVMVLSGTLNYAGAAQTFNFKNARIVHLPLVDYRIANRGKWEYLIADGQPYDPEHAPEAIAKRQQVVREALEDFKPDMLVTELFPFQQSFRKYDMEAIDALYEGKQKPLAASLCRDIIHNSKPHEVMRLLHRHFDHLLVRGDERFSSLHESQSDWKDIKLPIEYMGNYITPMPKKNDMDDKERHVVVFGGGGYYDKDLPFLESVIKARAHSAKFSGRIWDIYVSENMKKHEIADPKDPDHKISAYDYIVRLANEEGHGAIRIFEPIESKKFRKQLSNAAVVVTRGGYNTTFELYAAQTPQLVVPRDTQEQLQRANRLYLNGMAQIFPEYPIKDSTHINSKLKKPARLADAIDHCPEISASVPSLNNHGAHTTAKRLMQLIKQRDMPALNLLIVYEDNKLKKHDADEIASHLRAAGHTVTLVDAKKTRVINTDQGRCIEVGTQVMPLSGFDGATLRSPTEVAETKPLADALRSENVPVYQDYPLLEVAADKLKSYHQFEDYGVPTPRTQGIAHDHIPLPGQIEAMVDSMAPGPYVVKANNGWSGKQVQVLDNCDEAIAKFREFHEQSRKARKGGALVQEFIDSDPARRFDYRIQTVAGKNEHGEWEVKVVAAAKRLAQPGMRVTNVSLGADKIRVSLNEDEAYHFYVEKKGMEEDIFRQKLASGEIEILSPAIRKAAIKAATAFGSGSLGVDIVTDQHNGKPQVLEVNPFAGGNRNFEEVHGFQIYPAWAESFADHVLCEKALAVNDAGYWAKRSKVNTAQVQRQ